MFEDTSVEAEFACGTVAVYADLFLNTKEEDIAGT
jgi:hypothetical protein